MNKTHVNPIGPNKWFICLRPMGGHFAIPFINIKAFNSIIAKGPYFIGRNFAHAWNSSKFEFDLKLGPYDNHTHPRPTLNPKGVWD